MKFKTINQVIDGVTYNSSFTIKNGVTRYYQSVAVNNHILMMQGQGMANFVMSDSQMVKDHNQFIRECEDTASYKRKIEDAKEFFNDQN